MAYADMSPLASVADGDLGRRSTEELSAEIRLFRKALQYCRDQDGDDNCWMDYRHMLMRFLPGYDPATDDVRLDVDQLKNCGNFIRCWQENKGWDCLGGDKGKTVPARSIGTLDCLPGGDTGGFDGLRRAMRACEMALELMAVDRAAGRDDAGHFSDAINAIGDFRQGEKGREATDAG